MIDKIATPVLLAIVGVAALTTIFGRKNSASVFNALGSAFSSSITASLGGGAGIA